MAVFKMMLFTVALLTYSADAQFFYNNTGSTPSPYPIHSPSLTANGTINLVRTISNVPAIDRFICSGRQCSVRATYTTVSNCAPNSVPSLSLQFVPTDYSLYTSGEYVNVYINNLFAAQCRNMGQISGYWSALRLCLSSNINLVNVMGVTNVFSISFTIGPQVDINPVEEQSYYTYFGAQVGLSCAQPSTTINYTPGVPLTNFTTPRPTLRPTYRPVSYGSGSYFYDTYISPISCNTRVTGYTSQAYQRHVYTFTTGPVVPPYITIDTCGSNFDTYLYIYNGAIANASTNNATFLRTSSGAAYACDDCGPCGTRTGLTFPSYSTSFRFAPNSEYSIVVAGFSSRFGSYNMNFSCCANAADCALSGTSYYPGYNTTWYPYYNTTTTPVVEIQQGFTGCGQNQTGSIRAYQRDLWFFQTGPTVSNYITISTCNSNFDTWLRVYRGAGATRTQIYNCDDCGGCGTRTVNVFSNFSPNTLYTISVGGFSSRFGTYELEIACCAVRSTCGTQRRNFGFTFAPTIAPPPPPDRCGCPVMKATGTNCSDYQSRAAGPAQPIGAPRRRFYYVACEDDPTNPAGCRSPTQIVDRSTIVPIEPRPCTCCQITTREDCRSTLAVAQCPFISFTFNIENYCVWNPFRSPPCNNRYYGSNCANVQTVDPVTDSYPVSTGTPDIAVVSGAVTCRNFHTANVNQSFLVPTASTGLCDYSWDMMFVNAAFGTLQVDGVSVNMTGCGTVGVNLTATVTIDFDIFIRSRSGLQTIQAYAANRAGLTSFGDLQNAFSSMGILADCSLSPETRCYDLSPDGTRSSTANSGACTTVNNLLPGSGAARRFGDFGVFLKVVAVVIGGIALFGVDL